MAIKVYKKNTAGRRNMSIVKPDNLTDKKPGLRKLDDLTERSQPVIKEVDTKDDIVW
ncbi:MAG: hypothetical protein US10_C0009G0035 [Candidatus Moranbacteria bacterium GW2011_GWD2_36_198]|nr:MAG: hypothetical protein US10_C0009G0035 [Candidatus Moranbacteria bacterium GW2011_GWD2_36_198]